MKVIVLPLMLLLLLPNISSSTSSTTSPESSCATASKCVVSLVAGDNYALGACVLARSLRATRSVLPTTRLIAIVPFSSSQEEDEYALSESSMAWLRTIGGFEIVHPPKFHDTDAVLGGMRKDLASKRMAAAKLWTWTLEKECSRILYMDSDSFVRSKMDFLDDDRYWLGNISAVQEYDLGIRDEFKGGHLAIRPSRERYDNMMAVLETANHLTNSDQTLLNMVFKTEWQAKPTNQRLPREGLMCSAYCVLVHYKPDKYADVFARMQKSALVFDFQGQSKPWNFPKPDAISFPACKAIVPFVYAWVAVCLAPTLESVKRVLEREKFGQMQTLLNLVQDAYDAFSKGDADTKAYYRVAAKAVKDVLDVTSIFK